MTQDTQQLLSQIDTQLHDVFGFNSFRPGQREAIETLLIEGGLLCLQPTGAGKSLLYQLPASMLDGLTLVISPLLALMRDQIGQLEQRFGIRAASINSDQSEDDNDLARIRAKRGDLKILFIAPEQLDNLDRFEFLLDLNVEMVVVDEAHCISSWGHDFRPAYREIAKLVAMLRQKHPEVKVLGLTATADRRAEHDISAQLAPTPDHPLIVHRRSMERENLSLYGLHTPDMAHKLATLKKLIPMLPQPGLIYCATRDNTELVSDFLTEEGLDVPAYHAGKTPEQKEALQRSFLLGDYPAIVATNALGMGIDKSDLRFVLHVDVPGSITAYYQEVGRAGRDGLPAQGILLFSPDDRRIQEHFIHSARPTREDFDTILRLTSGHTGTDALRLTDIKRKSGLHPTRVIVVVAELIEQGLVEKVKQGRSQVYERTSENHPPDLSRYVRQEEVRTRELERMMDYGHGDVDCYMRTLRLALGDDEAEPCGRCGQCTSNKLLDEPITKDEIAEAQAWIEARPVVISGARRPVMSEGRAVYDSNLRSENFMTFMKQRLRSPVDPQNPLEPVTLQRLERAIEKLIEEHHQFDLLVAVPSRRWAQRDEVARWISNTFDIPLNLDALQWIREPDYKQGELLNNDQRRANVKGTMMSRSFIEPETRILILDDYTGSSATLKEAVTTLRKQAGAKGDIVPLTIASVRWRLGKAGIV